MRELATSRTNAYESSQGHLTGNVKTAHRRRLECDRATDIAPTLEGYLVSINSRDDALRPNQRESDSENNLSIIEAYDEVDDLTCWYVAHLVALAARNLGELVNFR